MEKREDFSIPEDVAEWIGLKKSDYLSKLIGLLGADDFGFEEFHLFDDKIPETIESPDKAYEEIQDGFKVRTYIKSYSGKVPFHQIILGALVNDDELNASVFIPILSFVSRKDDLVKEFSVGSVIARQTLN
jgi:hypothetical protein